MKKVIAIVLLLTMALGLVACGGSGAGGSKSEDGLQIGFGKVNITPNFDVGLAGYGDIENRRNTDGTTNLIYVTCIAAKEGEKTILLYTMDTLGISLKRANTFRSVISPMTGVPTDSIFFSATHSHNSPYDGDSVYNEFVVNKLADAAKKAIADLAPATMLASSVKTEGLNFVRHYKMADGTYAGSNFGDFSKAIVGHASEVDNEMQIVKFDRGAEKKAVVMVNYQAHNDMAKQIGFNMISPGWVGEFRDGLAALSGCETAYFMGAAGNVNTDSKIPEETHNLDWKAYGARLAEIAYGAMSDLKPVSGSGIVSTTYTMDAQIDHSWDPMLAQAQEVQNMWNSSGKDAADVLAEKYDMSSVYHASAIINRAKRGLTTQVEQGAFRIHNLGFMVASYEMFCENGRAVKDAGLNAGYDYVWVISANKDYIPSKAAYEYRSYESDTSPYVAGTAEILQDKFIELLGSIK